MIESLHEVLNRHDVPATRPYFSAGARCVSGSGRELDLQGLGEQFQHTLAAFPDLQITIRRWVEDGDTVVTEELMEGTHIGHFAGLAPTGKRVRLPMAHIWRIRDGVIIERVAYHDTAGILRQLASPTSTAPPA